MEISGATIKAYRERLQLSQRDLAEILEVSQGLISAVELGRAAVSRRLMRQLRITGEEGSLSPTFAEFMEQGGVERRPAEAEFRVVRPLPLEPWHARVNLRKPADPGVPDRIWVPGTADGARAFQFAPPVAPLAPDRVAVFAPSDLGALATNQVILVQFERGSDVEGVRVGVAHLGRALVTRRRRSATCQAELPESNVPVIALTEDNVDVLMVCHFRGRYGRP